MPPKAKQSSKSNSSSIGADIKSHSAVAAKERLEPAVLLQNPDQLKVAVDRINNSGKTMKCMYYCVVVAVGGDAIGGRGGKKPEEYAITLMSKQESTTSVNHWIKLVGPRVPVHRFFPCCTRNKIETIAQESITNILIAQESFNFAQACY